MATAAKKTVRRPVKAATSSSVTGVTAGAADAAASAQHTMTETVERFSAMSTEARGQLDKFVASFNDNAEAMRDQAEDFVAVMRENFESTSERLQEMNAELLAAAREEMTEAVEYANELTRAKTIGDALEIHQDYWTNLVETRLDRARELTSESIEAARKSFGPMNDSFASMIKTNAFEKLFPFVSPFSSK